MNYLNYEFFDEFKQLDQLCRDIYGRTSDNKLGVTLYLDDMDQHPDGRYKVVGWKEDYRRLKQVRHLRNELAHSRSSFSDPVCSQEDIDFVRLFRSKILSANDPLSLLRKHYPARPQSGTPQRSDRIPHPYPYRIPSPPSAGCLGVVATIVTLAVSVIALLW